MVRDPSSGQNITRLRHVKNQKLALNCDVFKSYHFDLVDENVIDREREKLWTNFLEGDGRFHEILSELTFVHYWEKLSFKYKHKKDTRVGISKKLTQFEGISIEKLLPNIPQRWDWILAYLRNFRKYH
jgi:hypothetical protein